jgi:hypothetical protein
VPCADPIVQDQRSRELQEIRKQDQADRAWQGALQNGIQPSLKTLENMSQNDLQRRKRVGEIFGEGCLKSAADHESAFIVYQHGTIPGHYFQAFLWAKEAIRLGSSHMKAELALAVDRYLVSTGHKELFGTQATQSSLENCFCIEPIEKSFPQTLRNEYRGGKNAAYTGLPLLKTLNNPTKNCEPTFCKKELLPTPKGTIPGFW